MKPIIIIISGTPGTGKTTLAKELLKILSKQDFGYINVNEFIKNKVPHTFNKKLRCIEVDVKALAEELEQYIKNADKNLIIDSHLSHYLPSDIVDLCIITSCNISELNKRLAARGYSREKIRDNLDSEIFEVCFNEALEKNHKVIKIDTTSDILYKEGLKKIKKEINHLLNKIRS